MKHGSFHFFIILLIPLVFQQSSAIPNFFRILAQLDQSNANPELDQISPSPSPAATINPNGVTVAKNACDEATTKCSIDPINITACILHAAKGPHESHLIVVNNGENHQQLNVITVSPKEKTYETVVPKETAKEINVSSHSSPIVISAANSNCTLSMGAPLLAGSNPYFPSTHMTPPIFGAYFLAMVGLILGGTLFCCKFWKRGKHLDGVPYQELQMGDQGHLSSVKVESAVGWDEDWDDEWDEEKAVKSTRPKRQANGNTATSPYENQWGKDLG